MLGSSCELVDNVVTSQSENGCIFVDEALKDPDFNFETLVTELAIEKHFLKRVLVIDWDRNVNALVKKKFYEDSR